MQTDSNHLLAVGIFGNHSHLRGRIETLLRARRAFSARASAQSVAAGAGALGVLTLAASLAPHWIAFAQPQPRPAFEVISVKPSTSPDFRILGYDVSPSGKLTSKNLPLVMMIATAYHVPMQGRRINGAPDWISRERFDIEASPANGTFPASLSSEARDAKFRAMLQSLLAERFKLAVHSETKTVPVYAIVIAKNGPKLEKAKTQDKDCPQTEGSLTGPPDGDVACHAFSGGQGRGAHGQSVNIADLALFVSNWTDRPLVDKTGLKDLFKIDTQPWIPMSVGPPPADGAKGETGANVSDLPTIFDVFGSLGLKLEAQKAPVDYLVIDHVERPSANQ